MHPSLAQPATLDELLLVLSDRYEEQGKPGIAALLRSLASSAQPMVYLVEGSTGEYSDRTTWLVAAYLDEESAKRHVEQAGARARQIMGAHLDDRGRFNGYYSRADEHSPEDTNEYDPKMRIDYTGVRYYMLKVALSGAKEIV